MGLEGRVALVSGGSRGIGRAISLALADDGATVAVNYRRDRDAADEVVKRISAHGGSAAAYAASVDSYEDDKAMVEAVIADFGHVDILVNNAGIASRGTSVVDTDPAELERVVRVHALDLQSFAARLGRRPRRQDRRTADKRRRGQGEQSASPTR